eukprot:312343_1
MERLPFTINDLIQYNFVEDNEYFNLYIQIRTEFIKNHVKRSHYVGVLGAILLQSERQLETNNKPTWRWGGNNASNTNNNNNSWPWGNNNKRGSGNNALYTNNNNNSF